MFTKITYISLRSHQREVHEKRSYNAKVTSYLRFQKLAIKASNRSNSSTNA
jgi:hypothetical protein